MSNKGNLISELRREAGFTQKSLAAALHITDKAVSKWERGISLPDVSLLPKLSLLLGADMSLLLAPDGKGAHEGWIGLVDARDCGVEFYQRVYDKPMVYYILSHFMLLNIRKICFLCSEEDRRYLSRPEFETLGFSFSFDFADAAGHDLMIMTRPCFLFGSDLTHQFQGAMLSESVVKLAPEKTDAPFLFCPAEYSSLYLNNTAVLHEIAVPRTLGRGMLCLDMNGADTMMDIAAFVRIYQKSCGMLIGSLEEIAFRQGLIDGDKLLEMAEKKPYGKQLEQLAAGEG